MNFKKLCGVVVLGVAFAGGAQANPAGTPDVLNIGGSNFLNNTTAGVFEQFSILGGTVLASQTTTFSSTPGAWSGSLFSEVVSGDARNPLGGLDFVYQITVNSGGNTDGIHRMTVDDFHGFNTDVGFIQGSGQKRPTSVDRSSAAGFPSFGDGGNVVGWNFLPTQCSPLGCFNTPGTLAPGLTSATLIVYTNATIFGTTNAQFIDGAIASAGTFAPVPEPETYGMVLAGLGLMGFVARRRKNQV